jgi:hypothetical protein
MSRGGTPLAGEVSFLSQSIDSPADGFYRAFVSEAPKVIANFLARQPGFRLRAIAVHGQNQHSHRKRF